LAYFSELDRQADFALKALEDVLANGGRATRPDDFDTWYSAQALLTALGIIRRLLLGNDIRGPMVASIDRTHAIRHGRLDEAGGIIQGDPFPEDPDVDG
jgi:hypothetical protein